MTGLVNSIINLAVLPPASGAVVQAALFADDTERRIAALEQQVRESEAAYDAACDTIAVLERNHRNLLHENHALRVGLEAARRVSAICACGIVRR
jgi:hypothetical protein